MVRGKTFTEKQAVNFLETQKRELRAGKTTRAKKFNKKIRSERQRGLLIDDNFAINPKSKTFTQLAEVEVASEMAPRRIPKGMTPYQYQTLYGDAEVREIGEGHLLCKLKKENGALDAICFNAKKKGLDIPLSIPNQILHIAGNLVNNEWQGVIKPQMRIIDIAKI